MNTIEEILAELAAGRMVVVMDDEDRENEGDLLMAAACVRPEDINFMARYGRGLICLTLTEDRCRQLRLPLMVRETEDRHGTNFTVSIEAAQGVTTGISAQDRARTVRAAVAADARPEDLRQPGHVFPLMAQPGGVLTRAGHTEAGCDLARLAGFEPAAVIVEVLNDDGTMARRPELERFAREHGLAIGTIADLIRYRLSKESSIECVADRMVETAAGPFRHALVRGPRARPAAPRAGARARRDRRRRWCACTSGTRCATSSASAASTRAGRCGAALERIAREPHGIVILLRPEESPEDIIGAGAHEHGADAAAGRGAAHLRHRRADPARPRRQPHARAVGAAPAARHLRIRPRGHRVTRSERARA